MSRESGTGCAMSYFAQSRNHLRGYLLDGRLKKGQVHYLFDRSLYHLAFVHNLSSRSHTIASQNRPTGMGFSHFAEVPSGLLAAGKVQVPGGPMLNSAGRANAYAANDGLPASWGSNLFYRHGPWISSI